ncbi:MAG: hypothetical protein ACK4S4_10090 [Pyrinomonadaceae bacterium]
MNRGIICAVIILAAVCTAYPQPELQPLLSASDSFARASEAKGMKRAFLEFLSDDAVIFRSSAQNGKQFWLSQPDESDEILSRNTTFADISSNGMLGYTTGNWRLFPKGKSESGAKFGQYVTIWEKRGDGRFYATLDITIMHDKLPFLVTDKAVPAVGKRDPNKRGWSPADASMNFLRASMTGSGLAGAYERFAADEVRLLIEGQPPFIGKKRVVEVMKGYQSIEFPKKATMFQATDMAYVWNPCRYANSDEGVESGNCLHIWKLRDKKWWIVLGVFAPVVDSTEPVLKPRSRTKRSGD